MMTQAQRRFVWILFAVIFIASAAVAEHLKPQHDEYMRAGLAKKVGEVRDIQVGDNAFQALLPTLLGVREVLASLMWMQADDYFHRGEYRPIVKMVKTITTIDPHQLDVYATGAWHMAYNFMDKRLIEDGVKFLEDGCRNNQTVYDLFFELGYMHYDKTKDYSRSVAAYQDATGKATTTGKPHAPAFVRHQLAHAMEKMGDIDLAIQQWDRNVETSKQEVAAGEVSVQTQGPNLSAALHNSYITERRRNERLARLAERDGNRAEALRLWQANLNLANEWLEQAPGHPNVSADQKVARNHVERVSAGKLNRSEPSNLGIQFTVTRVGPRQLLVEGTCNALQLSRVRVKLQDKDYEQRAAQGFDFKMNNCTLEWDDVSLRDGKFKKMVDLNKDPADMERDPTTIYPLKADQYELSVSYNPRLQAAFIQDLYGWHGENMTGKPEHLKIDPSRAGKMDGKTFPLRTISTTLTLKRDDILGTGKKVLAEVR